MTQIQRHRSNKYVKMLDLFRQFYSKKDGFNQLFTSKSAKCRCISVNMVYYKRYYLVTLGETRPCLGIGDCSGGFDVDKIIRLT